MTNDELIAGLEQIKSLLISVATGGPRINDVEQRYHQTFAAVAAELARRRLENPITFGSLWDWYGRWSSGDLPSSLLKIGLMERLERSAEPLSRFSNVSQTHVEL